MKQMIQSAFAKIDRGAWLRFFGALLGLTLAFGTAIYSTVLRESGSLMATVLAASISLLLAGVVGITTVPYLAKRVAVRRVRDAFDYDVTKEGGVYILLIILLGIGALNTNNNLLFIIVSAMLAAIFVSGVSSAAMLRDLELEVILPDHV